MVDIEAVKTFADKNNLELYYKIHPKTDENKINTLNKILKIEKSTAFKQNTSCRKYIGNKTKNNFWLVF